ncbi:hypothetical protein PIB30_083912 [Stylosanthes scabra]|uniref:Uncharacterized protein n=1 Tax=Stylosanthes scabra TaxID=79078 RepID=A0ABU6SSL6_9FABA|nr:hypothetical protein [Stylosanthes scabra]
MESDDGSSIPRRSAAGGGGGGQRLSSTQCHLASTVGHERDRAAPKCHCRAYAILYLSKTAKNPHRLFFGAPSSRVVCSTASSSYGLTSMR